MPQEVFAGCWDVGVEVPRQSWTSCSSDLAEVGSRGQDDVGDVVSQEFCSKWSRPGPSLRSPTTAGVTGGPAAELRTRASRGCRLRAGRGASIAARAP
jgi:hypothetical protein